ncbi:MAG: hypothetical protein EP343_01305 [Deltaproteobacteria bacterium]|nr:MAG: hypothetical protein EP343_01305 [Deltaproteobacteria bacterium]
MSSKTTVNVRRHRRELGSLPTYLAIFLVVAGAYLVLTFLPPWYKSWQAKSLMGETVSGMTVTGMDEDTLKANIVGKLNKIGVDISEGDVHVEVNNETKTIVVQCDWKAQIKWPFTKSYTSINFHMKVKRKSS